MPSDNYYITSAPGGVTIRVYVAPRASTNAVAGVHNGEVKVLLTAPPVEGAANRALVEFLAKCLGVSKGSVRITSGETSRHKVVRIEGVGVDEAWARLLGNRE